MLATTDIIGQWGNTSIDRFLLEYGLEETIRANSRADRGNALGRHLLANPEATTEDGENLTDAVVFSLVNSGIEQCRSPYGTEFDYEAFREHYPALHRGLERDGFTVEDGVVRRTLPGAIALPQTDDEVHLLLDRYGFRVPKGHLDQGIAAHARGDWAAANAQFRPFIESLFDCIAEAIAQGATLPPPGNDSRVWLANRNPPFFLTDLNEWNGQGHGFIQGFFRRLHPAGAHPGLSDEEDSTFRLHLVLLVGRYLLRRIEQVG